MDQKSQISEKSAAPSPAISTRSNEAFEGLRAKLRAAGQVRINDFLKILTQFYVTDYLINVSQVFNAFDSEHSGVLKKADIETFCKLCLVRANSALLVVDVQNDFIDGSLSLAKGPAGVNPHCIIKPLNAVINQCQTYNKPVVFTYDWHPANHISFHDNLKSRQAQMAEGKKADDVQLFDTVVFTNNDAKFEQKMWPVHCVQDSEGAKLHSEVCVPGDAMTIRKGTNPELDSYSAFFDNSKQGDTGLNNILKAKAINRLFICGLALDVCVADTAKDAAKLGYHVVVMEDCSSPFDDKAANAVKTQLQAKGIIFVKDGVQTLQQICCVEKWKWKQ